jgi:hypothetical protein
MNEIPTADWTWIDAADARLEPDMNDRSPCRCRSLDTRLLLDDFLQVPAIDLTLRVG